MHGICEYILFVAVLDHAAEIHYADFVAYVFYETEPVEAAKALKDFSAKSKGVLEIKGGISDGKAVSADDVKAIAELPTKDQLLGQIAGLISGFARDIAVCVNGVSSGLARSIQQVSEQKAA